MNVEFETKPYGIAFGPVVDGQNGLLKTEPKTLLELGEFTDYAVSEQIMCLQVNNNCLQRLKNLQINAKADNNFF